MLKQKETLSLARSQRRSLVMTGALAGLVAVAAPPLPCEAASNPNWLAVSNSVMSSQHTSLADAAAAAAGTGSPTTVLVIDKNWTMTGDVVVTNPIYFSNGVITLGTHNLTLPAQTFANPYFQCFNQASTGEVHFSAKTTVSVCWWGADPTGNTSPSVELATHQAFQYAVYATDPVPGCTIAPPPGFYMFDVTNAVMFRNCNWKATPGTVRVDFDKNTVAVNVSTNGIHGIFCTSAGDPHLGIRAGERDVTKTHIVGVNQGFLAALDPATMCQGIEWSGIDIVSSNVGSSFLGANKFLFGLQWNFVYGGTVKDSWFVGLPNDGVNGHGGNNVYINCKAWLNGFYGGAMNGDSSRNGISTDGYWDVFRPYLTSRGNQIIGCDIRCNANSGLNPGLDDAAIIIGGVNIGNGTGIENFGAIQATEWTPNKTVATNDIYYVRGGTGSPPGLGGHIYYYTAPGSTDPTTAPTGTTLGLNFSDGSATCQYVGPMQENGKIPSALTIADLTIDGASPVDLFVPYLGTVAVPASFYGTGGNQMGLDLHGGNESRYQIEDVRLLNCGSTAQQISPMTISTNNGGDVYIDGLIFDNCAVLGGGSVGLALLALSSAAIGTTANNSARVRADNVRFLNCTGLTSSTDAQFNIAQGNITAYNLTRITTNAPAGANFIQVDHNKTGVVGYALESGVISDCYSESDTQNGILLRFRANAVLTNGITVSRNRLQNLNAGNATNQNAFLHIVGPGSGGVLTGSIHVSNDNEASYAGDVNYPIRTESMPTTPTISLYAHRNRLNEGSFKLGFSGGIDVTNSDTAFLNIDQYDNGLLGEKQTTQTGVPAAGAWWRGDMSKERLPAAGGASYYECVTSGGSTTGGLGVATVASGTTNNNFVTYSGGAPPAVGEVIMFAGDAHQYSVRSVDTVNSKIYVTPTLLSSPAGAAVSYGVAAFKASNLAA